MYSTKHKCEQQTVFHEKNFLLIHDKHTLNSLLQLGLQHFLYPFFINITVLEHYANISNMLRYKKIGAFTPPKKN